MRTESADSVRIAEMLTVVITLVDPNIVMR